MGLILRNKIVYIWTALVALTLSASWASVGKSAAFHLSDQAVTSVIFTVAFLKTRLVIMHFMEVGTAPLLLRLIMELWLLIAYVAMLSLYWLL
jgi:Prokaryotic Cytochrome C oxidase subunit IV